MSELELTQTIFDKLVDLLIRNETQTFINYFNDGCKNIDFTCEFKTFDLYPITTTTILFVAGYYRNIEAMKCLIKNGASFNEKYFGFYEHGITIFDKLCSIMSCKNQCERYKQYGVDDYSFMKFCLENGADPNLKIKNFMSGFQYILLNTKEESIIELFINYGADLHGFYTYEDNDKIYILETLCKNIQLKLESKLELISRIKHSYTDEELYNLSKIISNSSVPDRDDIVKELDTIGSNDKSAAKIKIA